MAKLSPDEIRNHAAKAGFTGPDLDIAVAVAIAESGGDPKAHNSTPPDDSYGLWQINMLGSMGPSRRKQFGIASNDALYDPATNARAAFMIFKGQGWERGWTTFKSGKYKSYLPAIGIDGEPVKQDANSGIVGAINAFGSTMFKGITNVAGIGVAVSLVIIGVVFLVLSSSNAKKAVNVAANVIPGGNVVKQAAKGVVKS